MHVIRGRGKTGTWLSSTCAVGTGVCSIWGTMDKTESGSLNEGGKNEREGAGKEWSERCRKESRTERAGMRPAMAVMEMQAQESSGPQGHQHLWLEKDPGRGKELEAAFGAFLGDQLGLVTKCQRQTVLGRPAERGSRGG